MNWVEELATRKRLIEEQSVGVWKDFVDHTVAVVDTYNLHFSTGNPKNVTKERNDLAHYIVVECREDLGATRRSSWLNSNLFRDRGFS